jgi:hypothetical protein
VIISVNIIKRSMFVVVKCCVFFVEQTKFLNIIYTSFAFKRLKMCYREAKLICRIS